ncbi:hypothetical protein MNBD_NITROSPIRAE01-1899 [hydrothermal vent metagenome]|uniref:Uncharacterized protein n=1 Tax=hydrothermal vent metagenome TaxID=652676 RepID=A0A3B1DC20_9ZZZZ
MQWPFGFALASNATFIMTGDKDLLEVAQTLRGLDPHDRPKAKLQNSELWSSLSSIRLSNFRPLDVL